MTRYWLTAVWVLPAAVLSWAVLLPMWVAWGTRLHWNGGLWFELKASSWPARTWYRRWKGTTLVGGGFLGPGMAGGDGIDTKIEVHEHVHVKQFEGLQLLSFLYGVAIVVWDHSLGGILLGLSVWSSGAFLGYLCASFQAWIRGEKAYSGNMLEKAAYSLVREWERRR